MRNRLTILLLLVNAVSLSQKNDLYIEKLTNINPVSYTDVIYTGNKDTVLVSTYSGRIAKIINGVNKEKVVAQVNDEIYALAYNKKKKEIIASTFSMGILVINELSGKIVKSIPLQSSWATTLVYSEDFSYLATQDQKGKRYIFDVRKNYINIGVDTLIPKGRVVNIGKTGISTIATAKKIVLWSLPEKRLIKEWNVEIEKIADVDSTGNVLFINFNECTKYSAVNKLVVFKIKHPNWPLANPENESEVFEIPYQMQLNAGKFAKNYIYTGGIDRTIRVWDKSTGSLITTLKGHKGSISKIKVSGNQDQVVSIDLKGVINFWDVK